MPRSYLYHEEIKILMSEVFREGNMTDDEWTLKYEKLKERTPLEEMGQLIDTIMGFGHKFEDAIKIVKQILVERKRKNEISNQ